MWLKSDVEHVVVNTEHIQYVYIQLEGVTWYVKILTSSNIQIKMWGFGSEDSAVSELEKLYKSMRTVSEFRHSQVSITR